VGVLRARRRPLRRISLDALAPRYFNHAAVDYNDVIGTGKARVGFDQVTFEKAAHPAPTRIRDALRGVRWRHSSPKAAATRPDYGALP
jgi:DNA polymerase-1